MIESRVQEGIMILKIFYNSIWFCLIAIFHLPANALCQEVTIRGYVKNDLDEALPSVSVTLVDTDTSIIAFAITNQQGEYQLTIPGNQRSSQLWVAVSCLGYKKQRKQLTRSNLEYNFTLSEDPIDLSEVTVIDKPAIERMGDTLRYEVESFANPEDRSIGDVLRRMPGIDVDADGTIYHNGKRIDNLYIHGDDVMNGRYGLASKAIRKEMIASVDVMKRHQPLKVLKEKTLSDKTAMNLVLKDENSLQLSTKASLGVGSPEQLNASVTPILLSRRIKMVNTLGFNNSGVDYRNEFKQLGSSNFISSIQNERGEISLSQGTTGPPDLPVSNYYFNRSAIVNLNNVYNTKKELQFKANIQGFIDKNELNYGSRIENYLANGTVTYRELQSFSNKPLLLNTSFNLMINRERNFFNNNTKINFNKETGNSLMGFNDDSFAQSLGKTLSEVSNDMNWIPAIPGKGIAEIRWLISRTLDKQLLNVGEGYYSAIGDQEGYYDNVLQQLRAPTLFSNAYIAYRIPGKVYNQQYKVGYTTETQELTTSLDFFNDGQSSPYQGDAGNDLTWNRRNILLSAEYQIKHGKLRSTIHLPVAFQRIHYYQSEYGLNSKNNDLLFNPSVDISYDFDPERYLSAGYRFSNIMGNITDIYRGAILQNYRLLQANDTGLQKRNVHSYDISFNFEKSISMLFANVGVSYDKIGSNTVLSTNIADNIQRTVVLPQKNTRNNIALNAGLSKYLFALKSTVSLKTRLNLSRYDQLINDELLSFRSNGLYLNTAISKEVAKVFNFTYELDSWWNVSKSEEGKALNGPLTNSIFSMDQHLTLVVTNQQPLLFEINGRHSYNHQSGQEAHYYFMDAKISYHNKKHGYDLSLDITNLFNVKHYTRYSVDANMLFWNQYDIRGRMAILRIDYFF